MTNHEKNLIDIIRTHDNPEQAIEIAIKIMIEFLEQDESSQGQPLACPRESA